MAYLKQTSVMPDPGILPTWDEVSLLSSFSLITETKEQENIQKPSSLDLNLKYCLFLHLNKKVKQFKKSKEISKVVENGPLATDILRVK